MAEFLATGRTVPAGNGWQWIVDGWSLFVRAPGIWVAQMAIFVVICVLLVLVPILGSLVSIVAGPVFVGGFVIGCRALEEGGELKVEHLFAGFRERFGALATVGVIYLIANVVIAFVAGLVMGASLFRGVSAGDPAAVAGAAAMVLLAVLIALGLMIPVLMAVWFAPLLVVFQQQQPVAALKSSFAACLKNIVPFLIYGVVLLIPALVATIPLGLGWLVLGPLIVTSTYKAYRDICFS